MKIAVFTDIDGSLLNEQFKSSSVEPIIKELSNNIAIVLTISKTRKEIEYYRQRLGIGDPFIAENGSAIFIPKHYFRASYPFSKRLDNFYVIEFGSTY